MIILNLNHYQYGNISDVVVLQGEELEKAVQRAKVFKERTVVQEILLFQILKTGFRCPWHA